MQNLAGLQKGRSAVTDRPCNALSADILSNTAQMFNGLHFKAGNLSE